MNRGKQGFAPILILIIVVVGFSLGFLIFEKNKVNNAIPVETSVPETSSTPEVKPSPTSSTGGTFLPTPESSVVPTHANSKTSQELNGAKTMGFYYSSNSSVFNSNDDPFNISFNASGFYNDKKVYPKIANLITNTITDLTSLTKVQTPSGNTSVINWADNSWLLAKTCYEESFGSGCHFYYINAIYNQYSFYADTYFHSDGNNYISRNKVSLDGYVVQECTGGNTCDIKLYTGQFIDDISTHSFTNDIQIQNIQTTKYMLPLQTKDITSGIMKFHMSASRPASINSEANDGLLILYLSNFSIDRENL